jgi:hypothetical protein
MIAANIALPLGGTQSKIARISSRQFSLESM